MRIDRSFGGTPELEPAMALSMPAASTNSQTSGFELGRLFSQDSDGKRTIRSRRRRRSESSGERAEAPRRRRKSEQAKAQPSSRPKPSTSSSSRPSSSRPTSRPASRPRPSGGGRRGSPVIMIGLLLVVGVCAVAIMLLFGGGGSDDSAFVPPVVTSTARPAQPAATALPTFTPVPFVPPSTTSKEGQTWLIMLYQDADDKILEKDIYVDLNEAERIGSNDRVHIVAQMDRYQAGYRGDGDWSETRRYYVTQDDDLERVGSQQVASIGEANMSSGDTLVDFVTWAADTFPADNYVLIMSDHGMGWPGGWSDHAPGAKGDPNIPLAAALGDELFLMELDDALQEIRDETDIDKFEMIGMDACLMSHAEVFGALAPHAHYAVASQETEPALGWAYTGFLEDLVRNPDTDGAGLSQYIVDSYIRDDQRIVDDQARADLLSKGSPMGGLFGMMGGPSAAQVADQMGRDITLSAIDLAAMPMLMDTINELSYALQGVNQSQVARARTYAQSFTSVFGKKVPPSYIDLGNFVQLLKREIPDADVAQAADNVLAALDRAVIAEKHGSAKPGATGVSIYFPNSQLYKSPVAGPRSYTAIARRFSDQSLWDDYLAYHYTGRTFEPAAGTLAVPDKSEPITAPGVGQISASAISMSSNVAAPGQTILLSTDISGDNVGYVKLFVGYYDRDANSILVADTDYLESPDTLEMNGVYYPDWGEGAFTMEFEWEPLVFAISDGQNSAIATFKPETYGATFEDATYTVDGIYTYADGGETRYARLYFRDGHMHQVYGFTGTGGTGSPREIIPSTGDRFTVLDTWMDLDSQGRVAEVVTQEGDTLTFGDQMFEWKELDAAPGEYIVGFQIEDLDGNTTGVYGQVVVE